MSTPLDARGNPDVMGPRKMRPDVFKDADHLRMEFNAIHMQLDRDPTSTPESARLLAMARGHLEIACLLAVKAISRE